MTAAGMHSGQRPPHADAALIAAEQAAGLPVGEIDGKEVYRLPAQELGARTPALDGADARDVLNAQTPEGGSRNPRFQPPKRP